MIYALGKGSIVVAIDMYSDYPPEVSKIAKISNPDMTYNYEQNRCAGARHGFCSRDY
jgi:hypothetical protein